MDKSRQFFSLTLNKQEVECLKDIIQLYFYIKLQQTIFHLRFTMVCLATWMTTSCRL